MSVAEQADSSEQVEDDLASRMRVIYEERSDCWINVSLYSLLLPLLRTYRHPSRPVLTMYLISWITGDRHYSLFPDPKDGLSTRSIIERRDTVCYFIREDRIQTPLFGNSLDTQTEHDTHYFRRLPGCGQANHCGRRSPTSLFYCQKGLCARDTPICGQLRPRSVTRQHQTAYRAWIQPSGYGGCGQESVLDPVLEHGSEPRLRCHASAVGGLQSEWVSYATDRGRS
jgi:hypothetical protein